MRRWRYPADHRPYRVRREGFGPHRDLEQRAADVIDDLGEDSPEAQEILRRLYRDQHPPGSARSTPC